MPSIPEVVWSASVDREGTGSPGGAEGTGSARGSEALLSVVFYPKDSGKLSKDLRQRNVMILCVLFKGPLSCSCDPIHI